jgi:hypothetical protein
MTRWLNVWKMNPLAVPADPEQAARLWTALSDGVASQLKTGEILEWGIYADGSGGYGIFDDGGEVRNIHRVLDRSLGKMPFVISDVRPVLDVEEARAVIRRA